MTIRRDFLKWAIGSSVFCSGGMPDCASPWHEQVIRVDANRCLGIRQFGSPTGIPIVYFHGVPGSRLEPAFMSHTATRYSVRLVAIDRPGIGLSTYQAGRRVTDFVADIQRVTDALSIRAFNVLGVSGGTPYALAVAALIPQCVTRVAIVSGHAPLGVRCVREGKQQRLIRFVGRHPALAVRVFKKQSARLQSGATRRVLKAVTNDWSEEGKRRVNCDGVFRAQLIENLRCALACPTGTATDVALLARDWGFCASQVIQPTKIWHGQKDRITHISMGRYLHRQIADSQFCCDANGGHLTTITRNLNDVFQWLAG